MKDLSEIDLPTHLRILAFHPFCFGKIALWFWWLLNNLWLIVCHELVMICALNGHVLHVLVYVLHRDIICDFR
jgi:hypothetical protein